MDKLIVIEDLRRSCGAACFNQENGGYGCDHPENTGAPGECHKYSCPVADEASYEDLLEHDPALAKEYEDEQAKNQCINSDWMVVKEPYCVRYSEDGTPQLVKGAPRGRPAA